MSKMTEKPATTVADVRARFPAVVAALTGAEAGLNTVRDLLIHHEDVEAAIAEREAVLGRLNEKIAALEAEYAGLRKVAAYMDQMRADLAPAAVPAA